MKRAAAGPDFLAQMAASSRARAAAALETVSEARLQERVQALAPPPALILGDEGFDLIAEVKLRSPSAGTLASGDDIDVAARAVDYARAGAVAVSVLTEPHSFGGTMEHLRAVAAALASLRVPAMRKDFLVDPCQVTEARAAGAGGVLIILRMLARPQLEGMLDRARELGMFALLEAFDGADLALARELVATRGGQGLLVGVNCRDLATLRVVPGRLLELAGDLPTGVPRIAESGVTHPEEARQVAAAGYDLALVGSALMTSREPTALLREMLAAGRAAARANPPSAQA